MNTPTPVRSFCRICSSGCGTELTISSAGEILSIRGDRDNSLTKGYMYFKGRQAPEAHHGPTRILRPLARDTNRRFQPIALTSALDQIGDKLRGLIDEHGPQSVAVFSGNGSIFNKLA